MQEAIDTTTPGGWLVFHIFCSLAEFERDLIRERMMVGLAAARRRGRVGGRPTVMTAAKTKQAARMVKVGTPMTKVAEVLGVSRTTLYRHLKTTPLAKPAASAALPRLASVVPVVSGVGERSGRGCPSCGLEPSTRAEAAQLRADLGVRWLHPDPTTPGAVVEARHCRACHPRGPVVDVECTRVGGPPRPPLARRQRVGHQPGAGVPRTPTAVVIAGAHGRQRQPIVWWCARRDKVAVVRVKGDGDVVGHADGSFGHDGGSGGRWERVEVGSPGVLRWVGRWWVHPG